MFENTTILVPLDGSPLSERSLPYAVQLARVLGAKIALMIAAYISDIPEHGPWSDEMVNHPRETSLAYLNGVRTRVDEGADVIAKVGYPYEMIKEAARETAAGMIVLSTHGRSGLGRWMYGSTAGQLLHSSDVPLFVIGKEVPDIGAAPFAPRHILTPLDGSALGEKALPFANELASAFDAKLTLMRVAPFSAEAFPMAVPEMYWPNLDEELVSSATAYLEKVRVSSDRPVEAKVAQGNPADSLLTFVETAAVDLVVMATHGRAGVQRALLGSTADRMLQSRAPVLLIRPS